MESTWRCECGHAHARHTRRGTALRAGRRTSIPERRARSNVQALSAVDAADARRVWTSWISRLYADVIRSCGIKKAVSYTTADGWPTGAATVTEPHELRHRFRERCRAAISYGSAGVWPSVSSHRLRVAVQAAHFPPWHRSNVHIRLAHEGDLACDLSYSR